MNKVDVSKALKLLHQDMSRPRPYRVIDSKEQEIAPWRAFKMQPLPGVVTPDRNPEDWEPQDD